jgi:hypothetical protein
MNTLSPTTSWESALEQLTALPVEHQDAYGAMNFMRAGRYRNNGRRLFDEIKRVLTENDLDMEVVTGFVDTSLVETLGIANDETTVASCPDFVAASCKFLAARLRHQETGVQFIVSVQDQ